MISFVKFYNSVKHNYSLFYYHKIICDTTYMDYFMHCRAAQCRAGLCWSARYCSARTEWCGKYNAATRRGECDAGTYGTSVKRRLRLTNKSFAPCTCRVTPCHSLCLLSPIDKYCILLVYFGINIDPNEMTSQVTVLFFITFDIDYC